VRVYNGVPGANNESPFRLLFIGVRREKMLTDLFFQVHITHTHTHTRVRMSMVYVITRVESHGEMVRRGAFPRAFLQSESQSLLPVVVSERRSR